jgi:quinone-modifying oxidoreductase subunit QmoA
MAANKAPILVIGGGISGITVALEAAEIGQEVVLVEKSPTLGGRVVGFHQYFPKLCPPTCGLEINYQRLRQNRHIQVHTNTEVASLSGQAGAFTVQLRKSPTFVNEKCVMCDRCTPVCPVDVPSVHDLGMSTTKAIHLPHRMTYPPRYVVERSHCPPECAKCVEACPYDAIDLDMMARDTEVEVASVVIATGWKPYDANKLDTLGFSAHPDVITNVMMERLAAVDGPTGGELKRPSDGLPISTVAFVQCAGSRDEEHLPYCSSICCLASLKQAAYVRQANPDSKVYVFYIDIRTPGKFEGFYSRTKQDPNIVFVKGKVGKVTKGAEDKLTVEAEDMLQGGKIRVDVDLVVLATGMESNLKMNGFVGEIVQLDMDGFASDQLQQPGVFAAGVAQGPVDVNSSTQEATGVALKAIQIARGG